MAQQASRGAGMLTVFACAWTAGAQHLIPVTTEDGHTCYISRGREYLVPSLHVPEPSLSSVRAESPSECCARCKAQPTCVAFTFETDDRICHLQVCVTRPRRARPVLTSRPRTHRALWARFRGKPTACLARPSRPPS